LDLETGVSSNVAFTFDVALGLVCRKLVDIRTDVQCCVCRKCIVNSYFKSAVVVEELRLCGNWPHSSKCDNAGTIA
jgi:hypothetical protein